MAEIISGVYKIINTVTGDFYIGSSKDVKRRWKQHKESSRWNRYPNKQLYLDMKKYGTDKFELQILAEVEADKLKEAEQQLIEKLKPAYNSNNAKGWDIERYKEHQKEYYHQNHKRRNEYQNKYNNQPCSYKGETLTLAALSIRFRKSGIAHPTKEAKKYLVL